jgi:hypothetical protein
MNSDSGCCAQKFTEDPNQDISSTMCCNSWNFGNFQASVWLFCPSYLIGITASHVMLFCFFFMGSFFFFPSTFKGMDVLMMVCHYLCNMRWIRDFPEMTLVEPGIKTKERFEYFQDLRHLLTGSFLQT